MTTIDTIDRFRHVDPPARLGPALRWARTMEENPNA